MIIKEMFYIPIKLKPELARASMTTSDVNNQWRSNFQQCSKPLMLLGHILDRLGYDIFAFLCVCLSIVMYLVPCCDVRYAGRRQENKQK
jgi:hypothetical protein